MKKLTSLILFLFTFLAYSQYTNPVASRMSSQFIEADEYVGDDSFGCQYFIKNNVFFKIKNKEFLQYKNLSLGKITRADIQNPLRIILYYENFNTVISLDNQLSEVQKINFSEKPEGLIPTAIGISSQNNLWVFNSLNQQLGLYNFVTNNYQTIGLPFEKNIKNYTSDFNYFYWIDESNQFYHSDIFGKKKLLGKIPDYDLVFIADEKIILFQKGEMLYLFDVEKSKTIPINNVEKSFKSFHYKNQNLAIFTNEGITNYKINLP
ncbi:hypothetical protein [Flavobacterium sp.]|uniref:hypothetical protein n=1 Tax=Flavobacterium sp. TaxID=239 RepID=UPI002606B290|nr:hypothetical protein [Flavobacterium sp.]